MPMLLVGEDVETFVAGEHLKLHEHVQVYFLMLVESLLKSLWLYQEKEVATGAAKSAKREEVVFQVRDDFVLELVGESTERHDLAGRSSEVERWGILMSE
jgi:hypothetical protein